jgi:CO/xanthine dehydrogenase FAD-binding subunit/aerobic-type carbon monoxide dehydrogenase small subunit (CoxS/CutS family)
MKPPPFDYVAPASLDEAVAALAAAGGEAKALAGGQSLVPMLNFRLLRPALLVDLNRIPGLSCIAECGDGLRVGAMTRHRMIETSPLVAARFPVLAAAMRHVAHLAIRNRGTIGGSLAHADPAAELPLLTLLLDAGIETVSPRGTRVIPAAEFFQGALTTALAEDELVTRIDFPALPPGTGWGFVEMARRHGDFALAAVAATLSLADGRCREARIALLGAGDTPRRAAVAEALLLGELPSEAAIAAAANAARAEAEPSSDLHASADYRRHLIEALTRRALTQAQLRATQTLASAPKMRPAAARDPLPAEGRARSAGEPLPVRVTVNGTVYRRFVEPRLLLADFLRDELGLTGTHVGCEHGVCGACTVLVDGDSARSCLMLAVQADGARVETVESLGSVEALHPLQQAFREHHALQCGFCTPGMLMTAIDLLDKEPLADDAAIRDGLSGNLCRCTGYEHIVAAVRAAAATRGGVRDAG